MFKISAISGDMSYRLNPAFERYAKQYKKAYKECGDLEKLLKRGKAEPRDIEAYEKAEKALATAERNCKTTPKAIKGGKQDKETVLEEANKLHKLDYYC